LGAFIRMKAPLDPAHTVKLHAGDAVLLSGTVYTARDAAHARLTEMIRMGEELPFPPEGAVIYYVGPCPAKPGAVIGSAGPTTSGRMDSYAAELLKAGVRGMIGKGGRSEHVVNSIRDHQAVYFVTVGGAGAYLAKRIVACEPVAFPELGAEAVYRLKLEDFPVFVAIDAAGNNIFRDFRKRGDDKNAEG
jgi:fumarate hydratase subunit beta